MTVFRSAGTPLAEEALVKMVRESSSGSCQAQRVRQRMRGLRYGILSAIKEVKEILEAGRKAGLVYLYFECLPRFVSSLFTTIWMKAEL